MSKELTPLQALKTIILGTNVDTYRSSVEEIDNAISIIETALKENEKLKECYKNELKNVSYYNNLALKYKKALEIIKEHRLDIDWFLQFVEQDISYQHYVYCVEQGDNKFAKRFLLSEEEYELLKEILNDE